MFYYIKLNKYVTVQLINNNDQQLRCYVFIQINI